MATGTMRGEPGALSLFGLLPEPEMPEAPEVLGAEYEAWLDEVNALEVGFEKSLTAKLASLHEEEVFA